MKIQVREAPEITLPEMETPVVEKIPEPEMMPEREQPRPAKRPVGRPRKNPPAVSVGAGDKKRPAPPGKLVPPDFSEWSDFIGTVVLRWAARAFVAVSLRGIDRSIIDEKDIAELELDNEQLESIAKPFAHLAIRSTFLTKHGREIMDSKDAIEAIVVLSMWTGRVNRVARKYKPRHAKGEANVREPIIVSSGENVSQEPSQFGPAYSGSPNGTGYN
jgi:hypothetical protein